jgi:hypothetical protein
MWKDSLLSIAARLDADAELALRRRTFAPPD